MYCEQCKTIISGFHSLCPLCHCQLSGEPDNNLRTYPILEFDEKFVQVIFNLLKLVAIASAMICVLINYITYVDTWWSIFVVAGIACGWIVIGIGIARKANLMKTMQWELYITCSLAVLWDLFTGWHKWSIEFVLPCACSATMISMVILSRLLKKRPREYLIYLIMVNLLGYLPILFLALGMLRMELPSLICVGCSLLFMVGIGFFKKNAAYGEMKKKLHV